MLRPHRVYGVETRVLASRQPSPQIQTSNACKSRNHPLLRFGSRGVADRNEKPAAPQRSERPTITALTYTVEHHVETTGDDACEVVALVSDRRRAKIADERGVLRVGGTPAFDAR